MTVQQSDYSKINKLAHLGLAVFGVLAYLTSEFAEDGYNSLGFLIHSYLGLSLAVSMGFRILLGLGSNNNASFKGWSPFSKQQWLLAIEDIKGLLMLKVPQREHHQGLAGLVQVFGLFIFAWMAVTGTFMYLLAAETESELFEFIEEFHEVGESLIPLYLLMHVGAVVLHSLLGHSIWQRMFKFRT